MRCQGLSSTRASSEASPEEAGDGCDAGFQNSEAVREEASAGSARSEGLVAVRSPVAAAEASAGASSDSHRKDMHRNKEARTHTGDGCEVSFQNSEAVREEASAGSARSEGLVAARSPVAAAEASAGLWKEGTMVGAGLAIAPLLYLGRALQRARALSQAKENFDESCDYFAARIFEVGKASRDAGNLDEADFCFDLSLKIWKDLHGDTDHPDIAATFYELGKVSQEAGDLRRALQCFHKSLAINLSLRQNSDQSVIAAILLELGKMSRQAVDLHQAEEHLDRCLNILRCLHKERGHPDIVATRYELLQVSLQAAKLDRSRAEQHFDKILPLLDFFGSFWSWRGDGGVNYIRGVLNEEKKASQEAQELYQVRRSLLHYSDPLPLLPSLRPKYPHISAAVHQQRGSKLLHSWFRWFR